MNAVFADTFYWIAFTNVQDSAHEKAKKLALSLRHNTIVTTEEVLIEYLNYFGGWGPNLRHKAVTNIRHIMGNRSVKLVPQTAASFLPTFISTVLV